MTATCKTCTLTESQHDGTEQHRFEASHISARPRAKRSAASAREQLAALALWQSLNDNVATPELVVERRRLAQAYLNETAPKVPKAKPETKAQRWLGFGRD